MTFDYITMDSTNYYVYATFDTMKRSFEIVEGENKGTALTGRTIRDIIGTKYSYEFEVQPNPDHITDYDLFYNAITAPTDHHVITLPFGQNSITFECMVESGDDEFKGQYGDDNLWESFTVRCLPMEPQIITDTYGNQSIPSSAIVIGTLNITSNGTFKVPSNLTGWGTVNADVQIPSLIELSVTANGTYTPTYADQDGYSKVTVAVPEPVIQSKSITENGTYTAPTGVNGYSPVVVNVPGPTIESKTITANGTYTAPEGTDGYSPVVVNVPTEEPTIESKTITANGTYTAPEGTDGYSPVVVNVAPTLYTNTTGEYYLDTTSQYYLAEAGVTCTLSGRKFTKLYAEPCYSAYYYNTKYTGPIMIGKTATSVAFSAYGSSFTGVAFTYQGETWYHSVYSYYMPGNLTSTAGSSPKLSETGMTDDTATNTLAALLLQTSSKFSVSSNGEYAIPTGYDGYGPVSVSVSAPVLNELSVTENGTYTPSTGVDGYSKVTVDVDSAVTQSLAVSSNGTYTPPTGVDGYSSVVVNVDGGSRPFAFLYVSYPSDATSCYVSNGTVTLHAPTGTEYMFYIPSSGTWTVTIVKTGYTYSKSISITTAGASYTMEIKFHCPSIYQEIEYIESSGTQYIDANLVTSVDFKAEIKFAIASTSDSDIFGISNKNYTYRVEITARNSKIGFYSNSSESSVSIVYFTDTINVNEFQEIVYTQSSNMQRIGWNDDTLRRSVTSASRNYCYLLAYGSGTMYYSYARLAYAKLYNDGVAVREFYPCRRESDGVLGLWDAINDVFYTNAGTGTFTAGPDV